MVSDREENLLAARSSVERQHSPLLKVVVVTLTEHSDKINTECVENCSILSMMEKDKRLTRQYVIYTWVGAAFGLYS